MKRTQKVKAEGKSKYQQRLSRRKRIANEIGSSAFYNATDGRKTPFPIVILENN